MFVFANLGFMISPCFVGGSQVYTQCTVIDFEKTHMFGRKKTTYKVVMTILWKCWMRFFLAWAVFSPIFLFCCEV